MHNTRLIVLRGPSGAGKSSVALALREKIPENVAYISQDYFRRTVLAEKDAPRTLNRQLILQTVVFALENGYHVILEGIFAACRYEGMFVELVRFHGDKNYFFYMNVSLAETITRHNTKPIKHEVGEEKLREWYQKDDFLTCAEETVIPEKSSKEESVQKILEISGLFPESA